MANYQATKAANKILVDFIEQNKLIGKIEMSVLATDDFGLKFYVKQKTKHKFPELGVPFEVIERNNAYSKPRKNKRSSTK